jgi:hypothetical protein
VAAIGYQTRNCSHIGTKDTLNEIKDSVTDMAIDW